MNNPTEKQIKYAKRIADRLGLDLPKDYTKQAYWNFIKEHVEEYNVEEAIIVLELQQGFEVEECYYYDDFC